MFQLTICHPPYSPCPLNSVDPEMTGAEFKLRLAGLLSGLGDGCEMRMVCGGRVIQDHLSLISQGVVNGAKVYVAVTRKSTVAKPASKPAPPQGNDPMMAPLLKFLADNPELYQQMLMSNPQMQKLIEKNPELRHALADPSTLKSMLNAATNPTAYNEMLRGHDRAISNLENIPEGFSHLKKVYSTLQEPIYDAFTPKGVNNRSNSTSTRNNVTSGPIPNPWAPRKTVKPEFSLPKEHPVQPVSPVFGYKTRAHKRKHTSSMDDDDDLMRKGMMGLAGSIEAMGLNSPLGTTEHNLSRLPFYKELELLHELGYEDRDGENLEALIAADGNVEEAINRLLQKRKEAEKKEDKK